MEVDTRFLDILVNPEYKAYKEVCMIVRGKPFIVKIPLVDNSIYLHALANAKIYYKLSNTSPPKKRGPKPKYKSKKEARHVYYENWKAHKAQKLQEVA